jgi:hypothetical protein
MTKGIFVDISFNGGVVQATGEVRETKRSTEWKSCADEVRRRTCLELVVSLKSDRTEQNYRIYTKYTRKKERKKE